LLTEGVAAGEFEVADVNLAALAIGGMISWAYTWHRANGRLPLDALCARMSELALQMAGVRTRQATRLSA
jgi:TetR/AcrR family transcriptional regulator, cholesterol catabolism regulator